MGGLRHIAKISLGIAAEAALPWLPRQVAGQDSAGGAALLRRLALYSMTHRAASRRQPDRLEAALQSFWAGDQGNRFHSRHSDERRAHFLTHHAEIVHRLADHVAERPGRYRQVVEMGCGDGHALAYAAEHLPAGLQYVGLDINASAIAEASARYTKPGVEFQKANAAEWIAADPRPGTILLTAGGVLEYFSEARVSALFHTLAVSGDAAAALIEPLDPAHDIAADPASRSFGREQSFSHPYPTLLGRAGLDEIWSRELHEGGTRWLLVIASTTTAAGP